MVADGNGGTSASWLPQFSSSCVRDFRARLDSTVEFEDHDIRRTPVNFARCSAPESASACDLDGVEISCQGGTLIEEFWSPAMNHRLRCLNEWNPSSDPNAFRPGTARGGQTGGG